MNNRKRKRLKAHRKSWLDEKVHQIFDLCLKINGFEKRKREETGKLPTVFFDFSGHTAEIEVEIFLEGWNGGILYDNHLKYDIHLTGILYKQSEVEECYSKLKEIYESMENEND